MNKDLITFKLTKNEWSLHYDRIQLLPDLDCIEELFEDWVQYKKEPRKSIREMILKVQDSCYNEHKNGSCTVTLNLKNKFELELWNETIDGNSMVQGWISDVKSGYDDFKLLLTHCRNINKKLNSIDPNCQNLWARWRV